jgi:hypothetical protein
VQAVRPGAVPEAAPADAQSHLGLLLRLGLLVGMRVQMAPAPAEATRSFTTGAGSLAMRSCWRLSGAALRGGKDVSWPRLIWVFTVTASFFCG